MSEILHQLGIDWKLLASQVVNFLVLLTVLTVVVYRPLLKLIKERRKKIEFGLQGAAEAEKRLIEIDHLKIEALAKADQQAYAKISAAETTAKTAGAKIISDAQTKAVAALAQAAITAKQLETAEMANLVKNSSALIRQAIAKAVNQNPQTIDEVLISEATKTLTEKISWNTCLAILL